MYVLTQDGYNLTDSTQHVLQQDLIFHCENGTKFCMITTRQKTKDSVKKKNCSKSHRKGNIWPYVIEKRVQKCRINIEIKLVFIQHIKFIFNVVTVLGDRILHSVHSIQNSIIQKVTCLKECLYILQECPAVIQDNLYLEADSLTRKHPFANVNPM